ncbi:long-chain-fatty-acid--CoA ligase [Shimia sp. MMG029]|uniref:long-chain-fatty-acid--CoA ligase n=1 Tax=Shimia sp. MMG029 TaxID=3021978 RepID=UPI0022FF19F4|nr:long-chain-fatty-acid--CoA ligase [Shimia sp. MMG029]MDA5558056.1 long-chain-fatty-acid--CoA ligase [Shimia sp. MMG029]
MPHPNARIPDFWPSGKRWTFDRPKQPIDVHLEETVAKWGDRIGVTYNGADYTYHDIAARVSALAGYLQSAGLSKGDRVLLYTQNCPQYIISFYAILRAGGAVVPVNPMNKQAEIDYLVADTGAKIAICALELSEHILPALKRGALSTLIGTRMTDMGDPDFDLIPDNLVLAMSEQEAESFGIIGFQSALDAGHAPLPRATTSDDLAVIPYSSGTTGQPKGCVHTHRSFLASLHASVQWNPPDENTVHLAALPFFHVTGMVGGMTSPVLTGGRNVILPRWSSRLAAGLIARYGIARWRSIATMAIDLVNDPAFDTYDLSTLKMIGGGGAAMPDAIAKRLKDMTGLDYIEGYGLSETMAATHVNPTNAPKRQCLGQPIYEVDSRVLEIGGTAELPHGEVGEIVMHAPQNFIGYWQRPDDTKAAFVEIDGVPFFRSGDIGYRDEDGYFFMVDRVKRMVNAAGFKVWPAEVEMLMLHHPDIAEACVIGAKDARRGECVKAVVVPKPEAADTLTEDSIIAWCKTQMSAYKCPTIVEFVDALPKSGVGKVLWKNLT